MTKQVFIIGAGRSGTNLLRDALSEHPRIGTWPCDEINYIFRHRKLIKTFKSDRLDDSDFDLKTQNYLTQQFSKIRSEVVLEKTCANSLRVAYIKKNFPEAKFIFIHRRGKDVALSAEKRWKGKAHGEYLRKKLEFIPKNDLWFHIPFQIFNKVWMSLSGTYFRWGPFMPIMINEKTLRSKCIVQWQKCIEIALYDFQKSVNPKQLQIVEFENLIKNPKEIIEECLDFIGISEKDYPQDFLDTLIKESVKNRKEPENDMFTQKQLDIIYRTEEKINKFKLRCTI
jgi:hypothetical protein